MADVEQRKATNKKTFKWIWIIVGAMIVLAIIGNLVNKQPSISERVDAELEASSRRFDSLMANDPAFKDSVDKAYKAAEERRAAEIKAAAIGPSFDEVLRKMGMKRSAFKSIDDGWQYANDVIAMTIKGPESGPTHTNLVFSVQAGMGDALARVMVGWMTAFTDAKSAAGFASAMAKGISEGKTGEKFSAKNGATLEWGLLREQNIIMVSIER